MKTLFKNKLPLILSLFTLGIFSITSCKKDEPEPIVYGDARIRLIHAVQGLPAQNLYQNDVVVSGGSVGYGEATAYLTIKAGQSTLAVKAAGTGGTTYSTLANIQTNETLSVFLVNDGNGGTFFQAVPDDNVAVSGKAKVRFLNWTTFSSGINVATEFGTSLATGLLAGRVSPYYTIDATTELRVTTGTTPSITIAGSNFVAGKIYTVWFDAVNSTANYHIIVQN